ncbi:alpha-ribazole phosphatase family protein [Niveibacterium sp. SC-1]|uniref:alpha-ribazole phosphatase family protein n=1 Tax=Niveibacterium sp. SC-1 TaxID=3135646 RepID=UPI00311DAF80
MELHLIRHPQAAVDPQVCYGRSDLPLAGPLAPEVQHLRALLPTDFALYTSPLQRCRLLAEQLGAPRSDPRLQEIDFGEWEMRRFEDIGVEALDRWAADPLGHRPPGGESALDMAARALSFLADIRAGTDPTVVVVAHGGPLRALAGHLLGLPPERWLALDFAHARLTSLRLEESGPRLLGFNR